MLVESITVIQRLNKNITDIQYNCLTLTEKKCRQYNKVRSGKDSQYKECDKTSAWKRKHSCEDFGVLFIETSIRKWDDCEAMAQYPKLRKTI